MLERLLKRVVLVVVMATVALTAFEVQAKVTIGDGEVVYTDVYVRIEITGSWDSATHNKGLITFNYPSADRVKVKCRCLLDGWMIDYTDTVVDESVKDGYVKCKVKCQYNNEETHEVNLYFQSEGEADIDLDCDADWDGDIDEDDDPIEESIGGTVGYQKYDGLKFTVDCSKFDPTSCTVSVSVKGGIALCSTNGGVERVLIEAPQNGMKRTKRLKLEDVKKIDCVKGVETSTSFGDCEIEAVLTAPGQLTATDRVRYTVVDVDVIIDGKGRKGEADEEEGEDGEDQKKKKVKKSDAFALYVDDFDERPFAPRAIEHLRNVELLVLPRNFPTNLQPNVYLRVDGDVRDYLFEERKAVDEQGQTHVSYEQAMNRYDMLGLSTNVFVLHGHSVSSELRDRRLKLEELKTHVQDTNAFTVVKLNLVPDYDRDHTIGVKDEEKMCLNKKLYWWVNDDADQYDCGSCYEGGEYDVPGQNVNNSDKVVNQCTDILDFFPVWVDAKGALDLLSGDSDVKLVLDSKGYGIVYTRLKTSGGDNDGTKAYLSGKHLTADHLHNMFNAVTDQDSARELDTWQHNFVSNIRSSAEYGILMVEGRSKNAKMELRVEKNGDALVKVELPVDVFNVEEMYNRVHIANDGKVTTTEFVIGEYFTADTDVIYLHGFKVSSENARGWHSDMFKRLYQSGSNARFWGVTWDGFKDPWWASPGQYYHTMAGEVAFTTAKHLKPTFAKSRMRGNVVVMAHSLGNMVVSSAIVDNGWRPSKYFMLNAAVPVEAYMGRQLAPSSKETAYYLIHQAWRKDGNQYPAESYCSNWYRLFGDNESERPWRNLTWVNRFAGITGMTTVFNYYSERDEVFEIEKEDIKMLDGSEVLENDTNIEGTPGTIWTTEMANSFARFCWQKQEVAKGLAWTIESPFNPLFDSSWCGWKFDRGYGKYEVKNGNVVSSSYVWLKPWEFYCRKFSAETAREIVRIGQQSFFKEHPVFEKDPEGMFNFADPSFVTLNRDQLLGYGIPALSPAVGSPYEAPKVGKEVREMAQVCLGLPRCRRGEPYGDRWLHCDLKDMAYCYTYKLFDEFVENGEMK